MVRAGSWEVLGTASKMGFACKQFFKKLMKSTSTHIQACPLPAALSDQATNFCTFRALVEIQPLTLAPISHTYTGGCRWCKTPWNYVSFSLPPSTETSFFSWLLNFLVCCRLCNRTLNVSCNWCRAWPSHLLKCCLLSRDAICILMKNRLWGFFP